ncbi:arginine--tRNA ligase [Candidatus Campbellbacteria bacterium RIFOXYC2_FULL_35_25]|uniref:Arginine--tRNA ligase n=1 Tax=Candidatus Campbellbacteria bacterium RIFOXYC2_FULL_35_25 TaxID=1797582 RepID=A0A1F5EIT4_9BACT|nr:MAG: arginine--tRNA ligase [Candidatus Campbellbacteria bacterium RIFOXYC2_FULL_35_25]
MIAIKKELEKLTKEALGELGVETDVVHMEHPVDLAMGDYSTNVAMVYSKQFGQNPKELAEKIVERIKFTGTESLEKVEVAGAGFINFYLSKKFFEENLGTVLKAGDKYGSNENLKGKKIMVEYTDPNPFKQFHIGHLMSNTIGESIARIINFSGAEVKRAIYQGDVGIHVAKTIYSLMDDVSLREKFEEFRNSSVKNVTDLGLRIGLLGQAYALGDKKYNDDVEVKKQIVRINKKIYDKSDEEINSFYEVGKKWSLNFFEVIYDKLGMKPIVDSKDIDSRKHFDFYYLESNTGVLGKKIVEEYLEKGVFEKSEGAIIFSEEKSSLHTRVFVNSEDLPTYEAKELGLAQIKFEEYQYDKSIVITGNEVDGYFQVLLKAMEFIYPELAKKTKHISHGMLRLPEGKMSSRTGNVQGAIELLGEVEKVVEKKFKESKDISVVNQVVLSAIKYSVLRSASGKDIIFDFDKSVSVEGNSGPYLQYTYARAKSVIEKAHQENIKSWLSDNQLLDEEITEVEKLLYRFPEIVERAGEEYEPHYIATYLFELAQTFNSFYGNNKIADKTDKNAPYKVALTEAVAQIIKNGLNLLGIESPERL